jgi:hypothetical protein
LYYCDDEVYDLNENPDLPAYDYSSGKWGSYRWPTRSYTNYRIPLDDPSAEPQAVIDGVLKVALDTLDVEKIAIADDWNIYGIIAANEEQIVFHGDHQKAKLENQMHPGNQNAIYNLAHCFDED